MEQKWPSSQDLLGPLNELKGHGFDALLQSLFGDLKVAGASFPGVYAEPGAGRDLRRGWRGPGVQRAGRSTWQAWRGAGWLRGPQGPPDLAPCLTPGCDAQSPWQPLPHPPWTETSTVPPGLLWQRLRQGSLDVWEGFPTCLLWGPALSPVPRAEALGGLPSVKASRKSLVVTRW